jgi:lysophospholipase L1-like esterase
MRRLVNSVLVVSLALLLSWQSGNNKTISKKYDAAQKIEFADSSLTFFRMKVDSLQKKLIKKVRVVHIGDSHIQADYFSGEVRIKLQEVLGNGGRGLVFPYAIAKTNGPTDYRSLTSSTWERQMNVVYPHKFRTGVSGISIKNSESECGFELSPSYDSLPIDFHSAQLFFTSASRCEISCNGSKNNSHNAFNFSSRFDTVCFIFSSAQKKCFLGWKGNGEFLFHGAVLENEKPGITYSSIGVNGARFDEYNKSELFFDQLPLLKPDLIVVSLGTNGSYHAAYSNESFAKQVDVFIANLKLSCPGVSVIFTAPPDNCIYNRKRKTVSENKNVVDARNLMKKKCEQNAIAWWNMYEAMGGKGSMKKWRAEGLAAYDYVHFSKKGYVMQGDMFSEALLEAVIK